LDMILLGWSSLKFLSCDHAQHPRWPPFQTQMVHSMFEFVFIKIALCPSIFYLKAKMNQKQ
jgi:hypothetical protein